MKNHIYKKSQTRDVKKILRFTGLGLALFACFIGLYLFFPILSWEMYIRPVFASASYASPIPKNTIITKNNLKSLIKNTSTVIAGVDYNNATNWVPPEYTETKAEDSVSAYFLSIPKINIENAIVSTVDTDLTTHLVHFPGTATPPERGTAAIFGHSTLPQLYDSKNYKTIFANILELKINDDIIVSTKNTIYSYKIFDIVVTDPEDTSYLTQSYDASYIYIVTCTPPGTTWKRLIVKARLENS